MLRLMVSTRNPGKLREIRRMLEGAPVVLVSPDDYPDAPEVEEDGLTLEENARKKAEALGRHTGLVALADDTGLEVDALGGHPGVFSARFAGPACDDAANRRQLLDRLAGHTDRSARFRTVMAIAEPDGGIRIFHGVCEGTITTQERGSGGFGYDALFVPDGFDETFAEMDLEEKNAISHRGRALRKAAEWLRRRAGEEEPA